MNTSKASFLDLFNDKYREITIILWINWFTNILIYYGLIFMIPITLYMMHGAENEEGIDNLVMLIIVAAAEIPAALVCFLLVDRPEFGRKNLMATAYVCVSTALFIGAGFLQENYYLYWISTSKFFIKITHILTFQYTTEIYESNIRVTGVGAGSSMSRVAGILMPFICFAAINLGDLFSPYWIFFLTSIIAFFVTINLPFDTTGLDLDGYVNKSEEKNDDEQNNT